MNFLIRSVAQHRRLRTVPSVA